MDDTRCSLMSCAAARMVVWGGSVTGARLSSALTGMVMSVSAGSEAGSPTSLMDGAEVSSSIGKVDMLLCCE